MPFGGFFDRICSHGGDAANCSAGSRAVHESVRFRAVLIKKTRVLHSSILTFSFRGGQTEFAY
jgi:hypothetical protein